jgi:hypothetical protein
MIRWRRDTTSKALINNKASCVLAQGETLMADITRLLAHGEESLEELGNTFLWRTGGARAGSHGIMMKLRAMLGRLTKHLRKVWGRAMERKSDGSMRHIGPNPRLSRDGVFNEVLHKSSIVGSEPLLNSPLELLIDKVRHIDLPLAFRMGVVHEIDLVATTSRGLQSCSQ